MVRKHNFREWVTDNCLIIFMVLTFASFAYNVPGIFRVILWVLIVFANLRYCKVKSMMDALIVAYVAGAFLSLTGMFFRPYPIEFFYKVFVDSYIPIIFYFIGKHSDNQLQTRFYNRSLIAILFVYIIGFYYAITMPSWYVQKTVEIANLHSSYTEDTIMYARFSSFLDSYHVANLGVFALCISFGMLKTEDKGINRLLGYISLGVVIVAVLLSQQRVAMFVGGALFIYYLFKSSKNKTTILGILGVLIILIFSIPLIIDNTLVSEVLARLSGESRSVMVSSRIHQWIEALTGSMEPVFGNGIGSGGHIAIEHGWHPAIADGSYFKIWLEGGMYSTVLFLIILIASLWSAFVNRNTCYVEFPILLFFTCSLIGANIIDMPYIIAPMWYAIGRVNKFDRIKIAKYEKKM